MDKQELITYISYTITQLSGRNDFHKFEHICREIAKARICSNIVPATGPVSAGGDQGRDFETFITFLKRKVGENSFLGLVTDKFIAFGCTLQKKKGLKRKLEDDVKKICNEGTKVDAIYFFLGINFEIAKRHEIIDWAQENHQIQVQILDLQAISNELAQPDLYWVTLRHLEVPSELFPRKSEKDWYEELIKELKGRKEIDLNYSTWSKVKQGIREATYEEMRKVDIPFWVSILNKFITKGESKFLKRQSQYEIIVAKLKGLNSIVDEKELIEEYLVGIENLDSPAAIEDAHSLLFYMRGAVDRGLIAFSYTQLKNWQIELEKCIELKLKSTNNIAQECLLLDTLGSHRLINLGEKVPKFDLDAAISCWEKVAKKAKRAPMFPLERFANRMNQRIKLFGEHPKFRDISRAIDTLLAERFGPFKAAEKCKERAVAFYENDDLLRAIEELHRSKVDWFADEARMPCATSMLLLSNWYKTLRLSWASKYFAMGAFRLALNASSDSIKKLLGEAAISASENDYFNGFFFDYLEMIGFGLSAHGMFSDDPSNIKRHHLLQRTLYHVAVVVTCAEKINNELLKDVVDKVKKLGLWEWIEALLPDSRKLWDNLDCYNAIAKQTTEQLSGPPFADVGELRVLGWLAKGVRWICNYRNSYSLKILVEQFLSVLQIILADLNEEESYFLPTNVEIEFELSSESYSSLSPMPRKRNDGRSWRISLASGVKKNQPIDYYTIIEDILPLIIHLISDISVLPAAELTNFIECRFKEGLLSKVFFVDSYENLLREIHSEDRYDAGVRSKYSFTKDKKFISKECHDQLKWKPEVIAGFSRSQEIERVKRRYSGCRKAAGITIRRVLAHQDAIDWIKTLQSEGWLDWHILGAIASLAINWRVSQIFGNSNPSPEVTKAFVEFMNSEETEDQPPVPIEEFSLDKLRMSLQGNMFSTIKGFGLELRQGMPDIEAIKKFLKDRLLYFDLDIEHEPIIKKT